MRSSSLHCCSSSRRSLNVGIGFEWRIAQRLYVRLIASLKRLSSSAVSEFGLSPIMWRVRFLRKAILSLPGVIEPGGKSHGLSVTLPSRSMSMHRAAHQFNQGPV